MIHAFARAYKVDHRATPPSTRATDYPTSTPSSPARSRPACARRPTTRSARLPGRWDGQPGRYQRRGTLLQAKGHAYSLSALLAGDAELAALFHDGAFATLYLAPRDYHRIHMPIAGRLEADDLRARRSLQRERGDGTRDPRPVRPQRACLCVCSTRAAGPMAVVLVGALIVGSMETVWHGEVRATPRQSRAGATMARAGARRELGRFNVGSTVIVLCAHGRVRWDAAIRTGKKVRVGQRLRRSSIPIFQSSAITGAKPVVIRIDRTIPQMVFDGPNKGRASRNNAPPSSG